MPHKSREAYLKWRRNYRKKNKDKINAYFREWQSRPGINERRRNKNKKWREKNPEYYKEWNKKNPTYFKEWRRKNPDYSNEWVKKNYTEKGRCHCGCPYVEEGYSQCINCRLRYQIGLVVSPKALKEVRIAINKMEGQK